MVNASKYFLPSQVAQQAVQLQSIDVGLMLKLQNKVKSLEKERTQLRAKIDQMEEKIKEEGSLSESAFTTLKVKRALLLRG